MISEIKDILSIISTALGIILTLYGMIKGIPAIISYMREKNIKLFLDRHSQIARKQTTSIDECVHAYKNIYKEKLVDSDSLIIDKDWEIYTEDCELKKLEDVIVIDNDKNIIPNPKLPKIEILPKKKYTYAESIQNFHASSANFFNGELYAASKISVDEGKLNLKIYETDYFSFFNTCKSLELMHLTKQKNERFKGDLFDLTNRYAGIGTNCITIFKNVVNAKGKKKNYFISHQRNSNVIESPGRVGIVPSGSFQPIYSLKEKEKQKEFNEQIINTVYREFCEEILHTEHMAELLSINLLVKSIDYKFLKYATDVYYLGIGLEPYNTKVEVLCMMVIDYDNIENRLLKCLKDGLITEQEYNEIYNKYIKLAIDFDGKQESQYDKILNAFNCSSDKEKSNSITDEGDLKLSLFNKDVLEQFYASKKTTPPAREVFNRLYKFYDKIIK